MPIVWFKQKSTQQYLFSYNVKANDGKIAVEAWSTIMAWWSQMDSHNKSHRMDKKKWICASRETFNPKDDDPPKDDHISQYSSSHPFFRFVSLLEFALIWDIRRETTLFLENTMLYRIFSIFLGLTFVVHNSSPGSYATKLMLNGKREWCANAFCVSFEWSRTKKSETATEAK